MNSDQTANKATALPADLVGKYRQIGTIGLAYEILGPAEVVNGKPSSRILLIESGEETTYPIADLLKDPEPV